MEVMDSHYINNSRYRDSNECSDSDIFLFSIVPLQLHSFNETNEKHIIWKNRRTSFGFVNQSSLNFKKKRRLLHYTK